MIEFNKTYIDQNGKEQTLSDEKILPKDLASKLFDENGTKNDYLQTCKNSDGKTLFDIFKE